MLTYLSSIANILLLAQAVCMLATVVIMLRNWNVLDDIKIIIIIPILGLLQMIYSTVLAPMTLNKETNPEVIVNLEKSILQINGLIIFFYSIVEYYVLCTFIMSSLQGKKIHKFINWKSIFTIIIYFITIFMSSDINRDSKYLILYMSLQLVFYSIYLIIDLIFDENIKNLEKNPIFFITGAIFILFSATCPLFYISYYMQQKAIYASNILNLLNLATYTFFYLVTIKACIWSRKYHTF